MTVIDSSGVIDYLLVGDSAGEVEELMRNEGTVAAPDVLVFEVLAVLRRGTQRGALATERAAGALADLGDLAVELFPSMSLRERAWELRENLTAADALFVALAELLNEPLATKDRALAAAARSHSSVKIVELAARA